MPTLARETLGGRAPGAAPLPAERRAIHLIFYWGVGCPHREEAMPFVARLESEGITVERVEGWARRVSSSRSRRDWR